MTPGGQVAAVMWALAQAPVPNEPDVVPVEIEWDAPDTCPKEVFVERLLSYLDGGEPLVAKVIRARARVEERTQLWHLDLEIERRDGTSRREFSAETCETVAEAGAFILAVAVQPSVRDRHAEPVAAKSPSATAMVPEPAPAETPSRPPAPEPKRESTKPAATAEPNPGPEPTLVPPVRGPTRSRRPKHPSFGFSLGVLGGFDAFAMPGVGGQLRLVAGVMGRRWRSDVWGDYRFATEEASGVDPDAAGRFSRWAVGARGCGLPVDRPSLELPLCAGIEAGQVIGRGTGQSLNPHLTSSLPWVALSAAVGLWWYPTVRLGLGVEPSLAIPLWRHEFVIEGIDEPVHTLGPVALSALAGLQVRLP